MPPALHAVPCCVLCGRDCTLTSIDPVQPLIAPRTTGFSIGCCAMSMAMVAFLASCSAESLRLCHEEG